jgi:outer membrane protein
MLTGLLHGFTSLDVIETHKITPTDGFGSRFMDVAQTRFCKLLFPFRSCSRQHLSDSIKRRFTTMKRLLCSLVAIGLLAVAVAAQTPKPQTRPATSAPAPTGVEGKVAYVNTAQFQQGILELKAKVEALNAEFEPKRKELRANEEELTALKKKIETQGATVTVQVRNQLIDEGTQLERLYKRRTEDYEQHWQKRSAEIGQPVLEKIYKFIGGYCQQRGIVLVVEAGAGYQSGVVFWASPAADITEDFMKEYNKANPVAAGAKNP